MRTWTLNDREEILTKIAAQEWDGTDLYYSNDQVTADKEIVLTYLKTDHFGLVNVSSELKNDKEVLLTALVSERDFWISEGGTTANAMLEWASDELKTLCTDYPGGPIPALQRALEVEQMGRQIPLNIKLVDYLEKMTFADALEASLTKNKGGLAGTIKKRKI